MLPPLFTLNLEYNRLELQGHPHNEQLLWRVLQPGEVYPLEAGVVIKLGKLRLKFREIVDE